MDNNIIKSYLKSTYIPMITPETIMDTLSKRCSNKDLYIISKLLDRNMYSKDEFAELIYNTDNLNNMKLFRLLNKKTDFIKNNDRLLNRYIVFGVLDVLKYFIRNGEDITYNNNILLKSAVTKNNLGVIKCLIKQNIIDVNADDGYALAWATYDGNIETVKYLLENGANVHCDNNVALDFAVERGHLDILKLLLQHGNSIHDIKPKSLNLAIKKDYRNLLDYLKSYT